MSADYLASSEFLNYVLADEISFDETATGQANLKRLLDFVDDRDRRNRDWAAFLISGLEVDSLAVRQALKRAADDDDLNTRDEAIVGLARRDREEALSRLLPLLKVEVGEVLLEAAAILGDKTLLPALRAIEGWDGEGITVREQLRIAIAACEAGKGQDVAGSDLTRQHRLS